MRKCHVSYIDLPRLNIAGAHDGKIGSSFELEEEGALRMISA